MAVQGFQFTPVSSQIDSTALANSTTATSIIPPAARFTLPNNFFYIGKVTRFRALGRISNIVTTPGTITFSLRFGAGPVIVATSAALQLNAVAKTDVAWNLDWITTCRSIGGSTSATLMHNGLWTSEAVVGSALPAAGGNGSLSLVPSAPAVGTGFDSTAAQVVDLFATFSIANAANSIQAHQFFFEDLN
jgi:hypothetical protein